MTYSCKLDIIFDYENKVNDFLNNYSSKLFLFKKISFNDKDCWPEKLDSIRVKMIIDSPDKYTNEKCILNFDDFIPIPKEIKKNPYSKSESLAVSKILKKEIKPGKEWMLENWNCIRHPFVTTFFYDYYGKELEIYFTSEGGVPFPIAKKISEIEDCEVSILWENLDLNNCGTECWKSGEHIMSFKDKIQKDKDGVIISHLS